MMTGSKVNKNKNMQLQPSQIESILNTVPYSNLIEYMRSQNWTWAGIGYPTETDMRQTLAMILVPWFSVGSSGRTGGFIAECTEEGTLTVKFARWIDDDSDESDFIWCETFTADYGL